MKLTEVHDQVSPEDEHCEMCAQEGKPGIIPAFTDYHIVMTVDGLYMNLCDPHYYEVATLQ